ncbi:Gfo/Idh/MocA family oxidoreductase [Candidatus Poribacteria bacterium]|nr:Gfo/Idh/MocA family oxidoreductase [Candidatus Poribacteria bacterium]MYK18631.1 Gfo/Idh/MocA family oxidoreductase [Candidatus Poribacteria bacterium]
MTSQKSLAIGIIGAGNMGRHHQGAIINYGASVVAVHDLRLAAARQLASHADAELATTELGALFDVEMDGVVITTPPPIRLEPIRMACDRGIPVMVEKPPALNMAEGRKCLACIEESGVIAAVGFQLRYHPLYERLKALIASETVHLVRTVCTVDYYLSFRAAPWFLQYEISGGPLPEQAVHVLDCARFVMGNPKPLQAHALAIKNMALERTEFDAENAIQMTYQLDNGVFGTHMNHCGTEKFSFEVEVVGPHLRLQANMVENAIRGYLNGETVNEPVGSNDSSNLDKIGAWLRAIETGDRTLIRSPFSDALQTLALIDAAVQSRGTSRFVQI